MNKMKLTKDQEFELQFLKELAFLTVCHEQGQEVAGQWEALDFFDQLFKRDANFRKTVAEFERFCFMRENEISENPRKAMAFAFACEKMF